MPSEKKNMDAARKSLVALKKIAQGEVFNSSNVGASAEYGFVAYVLGSRDGACGFEGLLRRRHD